ncbi:hypothetical protein TESG_04799 [Trichophyton tonsurans CBS 112818]|uniref:Uncharacterized protein n=1 Tax=Trichophyton tonsurans (strain CBS 112818) TaxID=647933 RepID=F2S1D9_TRIT1|nr:hypothetical protein TESG_04799 [Trichophyton tonsurans CBS 112818]
MTASQITESTYGVEYWAIAVLSAVGDKARLVSFKEFHVLFDAWPKTTKKVERPKSRRYDLTLDRYYKNPEQKTPYFG